MNRQTIGLLLLQDIGGKLNYFSKITVYLIYKSEDVTKNKWTGFCETDKKYGNDNKFKNRSRISGKSL